VIQGVAVTATEIDAISQSGATLIWSPRSNLSLYGDMSPVTAYQAAGVRIALGTDWLPSGSMNMLRELACADGLNQQFLGAPFTDRDLWEMATTNGAIAPGFEAELGSLEVGKAADIAVFDGTTRADYRAVIGGNSEDVLLVLRGGRPLYGEQTAVASLQGGCAPLPVCGITRSVCLDMFGVSMADLQSVADGIYPLASCEGSAPPDEPTCVPYRSTYPNGPSAGDLDGDGVTDSVDSCAGVFNPVRPMDVNGQSDIDGDSYGDACDAMALDAGAH
jgi:hypothetical protein